MPVRIPVYSEPGGVPQIVIYEETEEGAFRRTAEQPLRALRESIEGVGPPVGELLSPRADREERRWETPTVKYHIGRPQSAYRFLRERAAQRRLIVATAPAGAARFFKFELRELLLKHSTSSGVRAMMIRKYLAALEVWTQAEVERGATSAA
jgi:hypothetical protein